MDRPRIALVNAAHEPGETARNFRRELDAELVEFHAKGGRVPGHTEFDGVVVTGSKSSVYWDEPWIEALCDYVEDVHAAGVPVLGVCFGHQVLAEALGGTVEDMSGFELGYRTVERVADDPLFEGLPESMTAFTTHGDVVTELPAAATLLAENDYGIHTFRVGQSVGVQFHPEYDTETAERIATEKDVSEARRDAVLAGITPEAYAAACETKRLFENFTRQLGRGTDGGAEN
ncbi:type 1 glutamine amidotransferase [Halobacterium salinarum]|uniref:type 1 glutamine amidotransferase n=1 Tax=Halobacterium salinarum TaxID=2242 RepID=UPI002555178D|nr:type 1 glutamine amidotransferase [Halobacterium salinarum]MDL0135751.1 type 1 glutamine amidotransferase [Halobacterium salinarum]